jgi:hypothetical protein
MMHRQCQPKPSLLGIAGGIGGEVSRSSLVLSVSVVTKRGEYNTARIGAVSGQEMKAKQGKPTLWQTGGANLSLANLALAVRMPTSIKTRYLQ